MSLLCQLRILSNKYFVATSQKPIYIEFNKHHVKTLYGGNNVLQNHKSYLLLLYLYIEYLLHQPGTAILTLINMCFQTCLKWKGIAYWYIYNLNICGTNGLFINYNGNYLYINLSYILSSNLYTSNYVMCISLSLLFWLGKFYCVCDTHWKLKQETFILFKMFSVISLFTVWTYLCLKC